MECLKEKACLNFLHAPRGFFPEHSKWFWRETLFLSTFSSLSFFFALDVTPWRKEVCTSRDFPFFWLAVPPLTRPSWCFIDLMRVFNLRKSSAATLDKAT